MALSLPRLFVAIDTPDAEEASHMAAKLALPGAGLKLGLEFFCASGPAGIRAVQAAAPGVPIFLDLKFHDIPNTVAGVVRSVASLAPTLITLHASGGEAMLKAAVQAAAEQAAVLKVTRPMVLAVTVLTSMDDTDLAAVGQSAPAEQQVVRLATLAKLCGVDGVVCSAREVSCVAKHHESCYCSHHDRPQIDHTRHTHHIRPDNSPMWIGVLVGSLTTLSALHLTTNATK